MSGCEDCFNGCADITSDQCVKYTGVDVVPLDIHKGDTLYNVESKILESILTILVGNGVVPTFNRTDMCKLITDLLPAGPATLNQILRAAFVAICSLKTTTDNLETKVAVLNTIYDLGCLPISIDNKDTHAVVQALITKACTTASDLAGLSLDLHTNYVLISKINEYIAAYLAGSTATTLISSKMVPYAVQEYYGPLSHFDATGAGTGDWVKIYLCNGENNTPDKRGKVAVGVTTGMLGGALSPSVNPGIPGNPDYTINSNHGSNTVALNTQQLPSHSHNAQVTDPGHTHTLTIPLGNDTGSSGNHSRSRSDRDKSFVTGSSVTGVTVSIDPTGGGLGHPNIQPGIGCYFIQYRP
jgi:microcystin-dependent protein